MIATINHNNELYKIDLSSPIDISIPIRASKQNVNAWYIAEPEIKPVQLGDWIGKVSEGSSTNFNTITFNPHAHGTHTECIGHITREFHSINSILKTFFFMAKVITVTPSPIENDTIIDVNQIQAAIGSSKYKALVIRTLPNTPDKISKQYSYTNWPYITENAATYIRDLGIEHLLIDVPSIDKEKDEGRLLAHKAFWNYPNTPRHDATITELIYVENQVKDGEYFLNLQIASFENDASPSKPVLYPILSSKVEMSSLT
ncbi:cyclase family protein [Aquimarina sp. U1-2]|uniref:cyclase family protein n=1 Tax=Aquimarina sp. U1-2 TaxID=2823141 RepID=UPI001AEC9827|nr:cyclase family protein [Aquimarina sp. U1-2]MBP2831728.1 cyclase family protein [Aquimarina sp. U1-2]